MGRSATERLDDPARYDATVEPFWTYSGATDSFAIRLANGRLFEATYGGRTNVALFDSEAEAQTFISRNEHITVEILDLRDVLKAAGWDDALGYCDANSDRLIAYCEAEGIHFYAADRENFSRYLAVRQAQDRGLTKLVMEDLS